MSTQVTHEELGEFIISCGDFPVVALEELERASVIFNAALSTSLDRPDVAASASSSDSQAFVSPVRTDVRHSLVVFVSELGVRSVYAREQPLDSPRSSE